MRGLQTSDEETSPLQVYECVYLCFVRGSSGRSQQGVAERVTVATGTQAYEPIFLTLPGHPRPRHAQDNDNRPLLLFPLRGLDQPPFFPPSCDLLSLPSACP